MEKTIALSDIYAKFTKNFDTFGKMVDVFLFQQPFLTFQVGSTNEKTEASQDGLQPQWKAKITLKVHPQTDIVVTAYDEDLTENEYMGTAKFNISILKSSGNHSITIIGEDGKSIGDVFFNYQIQEPQTPITHQINQATKSIQKKPQIPKEPLLQKQYTKNIKITEISAKFTKNFDTFGTMQPFLVFKLGSVQDKTQVFQDKNPDVKWIKSISLGFNNQENLQIKGYDEDMTQNQYIGIATVPLKSLSKSGKHTVQMFSEDKKSIGSITFKYQLNGLFDSEKEKVETTQKPLQVSQKQLLESAPKPIVAESKPKVIQKAEPKLVEPVKAVEQKTKAEKVAVQVQRKQEMKPVQSKESDRNLKNLTQLSQKQLDKKQINLNNSIARTNPQLNKTLDKSRESLKLPSIGDTSKNYGDKIYDKQSSATLQKSILVYSMPKAPRFHSGPKYIGEPSYYVDSCFKPNATKGVGFGFGSKRQFPEWMEKNMKENPAPGAYFEQSKLTTVRSKGPTFGISYKYYEKVTIPTEKSPERVTKSNQRLKPIIRSK